MCIADKHPVQQEEIFFGISIGIRQARICYKDL